MSIAWGPNTSASGRGSADGPFGGTADVPAVERAAGAGRPGSLLCPMTTIATPMTASAPAAASNLLPGRRDGGRSTAPGHEPGASSGSSRNSIPPMGHMLPRRAFGRANDQVTVAGRPSARTRVQFQGQRAAGGADDRAAEGGRDVPDDRPALPLP